MDHYPTAIPSKAGIQQCRVRILAYQQMAVLEDALFLNNGPEVIKILGKGL